MEIILFQLSSLKGKLINRMGKNVDNDLPTKKKRTWTMKFSLEIQVSLITPLVDGIVGKKKVTSDKSTTPFKERTIEWRKKLKDRRKWVTMVKWEERLQ